MQTVSILDAAAIVICWATVLSSSFESGFWFGFKRYQKKVLENRLFLIRCTCYALSSSVVHTSNFPKAICRMRPRWVG
jgi:hypothetical protein